RTLSCVPLLPPASTSTLFPYTTLFRSLPPPGFEFLPDSTRARDECDEIDLVLETYTQSTATIGLAIRDDATHPLQTQGQTLLNGYGGFHTIAAVAIAHTDTQRYASIPTHPETEEHLFEIVPPV